MKQFSRKRLLFFNTLIIFILQKANNSLQVCLDDFFEQSSAIPTKSAFTQARQKLSYMVFKQLNTVVVDVFYRYAPFKKWKGFRVLGVDGSTLQLPAHASLTEKFSYHFFGPKAGAGRWMSRISYLYDVFNGLVVDAQMESYTTSESSLCKSHLSFVGKGDLMLFDRYYASIPLIFELLGKSVHFVFRMKDNWWKCVEEFVRSGQKEQIVTLYLPGKYREMLTLYPDVPPVFKLRLVRRTNRKGDVQIFATSLLDCERYSAKSIINLYKQRWGIEEAYKLIKARLEVADFSGKTVWAVQQDFYAKTMLISFCNALCIDIKPKPSRKLKPKTKERVPIINRSYALSKLKRILRRMLQQPDPALLLQSFIEKVSTKIEYSRKGQYLERQFRPNKWNMNYKVA